MATRCVDGRTMRHDPQPDDPYLETDRGECEACGGKGCEPPRPAPGSRYTIGRQPCQNLLRGDADIAALGEGNRRNVHQCPVCYGNRTWCDNCHADHHDGGWETCKPGAYSDDN